MSPSPKIRIRRFSPLQRLFHVVLILSFLTQGTTGLARMYIETPWGQWLSRLFGGYESALAVHKYVGVFMLCGFLVHALYMVFTIDWRQFPRSLFGPDSLLPQPRDIEEFFHHIAWFLGMAKAPQFDRWGYWEKFDYWGVLWGMVILGGTGLILAYPLAASHIIPGWGLNVAFWIHRIEAILAMCHVFIIHFFIAHLRRHSFPMDRAMFEGSVELDATRHEKPGWIARLEQASKLETLLVVEKTAGLRALFYIFGYAAIAVGVFLLIGGLVNSLSVTW